MLTHIFISFILLVFLPITSNAVIFSEWKPDALEVNLINLLLENQDVDFSNHSPLFAYDATDPAMPFFQAISATPGDNLPRLVYADWLDEHGEPEAAEFIRLQCSTAELPRPSNYRPQLNRSFELLRRNEIRWFSPMLGKLKSLHESYREFELINLTVHRGVVTGIRMEMFDASRTRAETEARNESTFNALSSSIAPVFKWYHDTTMNEYQSRSSTFKKNIDTLYFSTHIYSHSILSQAELQTLHQAVRNGVRDLTFGMELDWGPPARNFISDSFFQHLEKLQLRITNPGMITTNAFSHTAMHVIGMHWPQLKVLYLSELRLNNSVIQFLVDHADNFPN